MAVIVQAPWSNVYLPLFGDEVPLHLLLPPLLHLKRNAQVLLPYILHRFGWVLPTTEQNPYVHCVRSNDAYYEVLSIWELKTSPS